MFQSSLHVPTTGASKNLSEKLGAMVGDPAQWRTESKSSQSSRTQRPSTKGKGTPPNRLLLIITDRAVKRCFLWGDLAKDAKIHCFLLATAWG